jgi:hypothetical protein
VSWVWISGVNFWSRGSLVNFWRVFSLGSDLSSGVVDWCSSVQSYLWFSVLVLFWQCVVQCVFCAVWCGVFFPGVLKKKKKKKKIFELVFRVNQRVGRWVLLSSVWLAVFDAVPWCGVSPRLWNPLAWTGSE